MAFDVEDWQLDDDAAARVPSLEAPAVAPIDTGAVPVPADPALAFDQPNFGPPAPDPTDAIAATLPPAQAGIPTQDPATQFAPDVPREAPGNIGAPAPLPGAPQGVQPATGAGAPQDPNDIQQALADVGTARAESDEARKRQFEDQQLANVDRADAATKRREELERRQAEDAQNAALDKAANDKAQAQVAQTDEALKGFRFKDLFADKSGAQQVATALSTALLAIGAGMMKTPKYAIEILDKKRQEDHQKQMDNLALLKDDFARATGNAQLADKLAAKRHADINLGRARKDELLAAQFDEVAARTKEGAGQTDALAYSAKLKQEGAQAKLEALTTLHKLNRQEEIDAQTAQLRQAQIANQMSLASLHDRGVGQGRKAHGTGGGGGSGGGDALAKFTSAVLDGSTPPADLMRLGSAAHLKPNQIQDQILKIRTEDANEKKRTGGADKLDFADIDKRAESVKRDLYSPKGPGTQYDRLRAMGGLVDNAIKAGDRTAATSVLEEAGGMLSGGKSTKNTVDLLHELKSTSDDLSSKWGKISGNPGESKAYTQRLRDLLGRVQQEKKDEIMDVRQRYLEQEMGAHGFSKEGKRKERVMGHASMFGELNGPEGGGAPTQAHPSEAPVGATKDVNGKTYKKVGPNNWQPI
jgi:hypothetical protein